jgi:hypothetical protein
MAAPDAVSNAPKIAGNVQGFIGKSLSQQAAFPNGAHDDQVDAMTQALLRWHMAVPQETVLYLSGIPGTSLHAGCASIPSEHAE